MVSSIPLWPAQALSFLLLTGSSFYFSAHKSNTKIGSHIPHVHGRQNYWSWAIRWWGDKGDLGLTLGKGITGATHLFMLPRTSGTLMCKFLLGYSFTVQHSSQLQVDTWGSEEDYLGDQGQCRGEASVMGNGHSGQCMHGGGAICTRTLTKARSD